MGDTDELRVKWLGEPMESRPARNFGGEGLSDPVAFARRMGFEPDEKQAGVLRAMADPLVKQGILNCTRQWGKSTTAAAGAVYRAMSRPNCLVVVASPSARQSALLVQKAAEMAAALRVHTRKDRIFPISRVFPNGSRVIGIPGNEATVRGLSSVSLLLVDEAAKVPQRLYDAVRPMVAVVRGDVWLLSTPWSASGFFYEAWTHGGPGWARFSVKATECPRIPADWLEGERLQMTGWAFRREFLAEFVQDDCAAFDAEVVEGAFDKNVAALEVDWREYAKNRRR